MITLRLSLTEFEYRSLVSRVQDDNFEAGRDVRCRRRLAHAAPGDCWSGLPTELRRLDDGTVCCPVCGGVDLAPPGTAPVHTPESYALDVLLRELGIVPPTEPRTGS